MMVGMVLLLIFQCGLLVLLPKRRPLVHAVLDRAFLPRPLGIWDSECVNVLASAISAGDVAHWPHTTRLLVRWVAFLGTLQWPAGGLDLGVGGISHVELLVLYELWAGENLSLEKAPPRYLRPGRPISVSAVPFGPDIDTWRSCRFIGAMMRSLCLLLGGLGGFVPCSIGLNHCRLRHIGWEKCDHGLTSRLRESVSEPFLNELLISEIILLVLLGLCLLVFYPFGIVLLVLPVGLPLDGCLYLVWLLILLGELVRLFAEGVARRVRWVSGSGPNRRRIRLNRKTPHTSQVQ